MAPTSFSSDCTLCTASFNCPYDQNMTQPAPVCLDPECPDSVCDECSDHEECCEECVQEGSVCEDCPPDRDCCGGCAQDECGILDFVDCIGPHCEYHKDYVCDGSCFELFGDQAAEMFGIGGSLPQLPIDPKFGDKNNRLQEVMSWEPILDQGQVANPALPPNDNSYDALRYSAGLLMQAAVAGNNSQYADIDRPLPASHIHGPCSGHVHHDCLSEKVESKGPHRSVTKSPANRFVRYVFTVIFL